MKKVLLINPNTEKAPYPVAPLGICLIANALKGRFDVTVYDATFVGGGRLGQMLSAVAPHYVGISIRNIDDVTLGSEQWYIDEIKRDYVEPVRALCDAPLVLGGSGFALFPGLLLRELGADFGVVGEGEKSFIALLDALESGGDPGAVPGVVTASSPLQREVAAARSRGPLEIPFATVDEHIDFTPYRARGTYPVQTKRGCHLKCVYCSYPTIEGAEYRLRSPQSIADEMEDAADRLKKVVFEFVDSTFNAPSGHAEAVLEEIIRRQLDIRIRCMGINPGGVTDGLLELMKKAGFAQIVCSADTASPSMLKSLGKGFTRDKLEKVATLIRKHDLPTMWSMIFGGPGETEKTVEETFDFIERFVFDLDMVHMTEGIRVYPGAPIHDISIREGVVQREDNLLKPVFYVSPALGRERLFEIIKAKSDTHLNCIRNIDSSPPPAMIKAAMALRKEEGLDEPMFRTLLRVRRIERCV